MSETPELPELPSPEEPDYLTPYDVYTSSALRGLLDGRHVSPHDPVALAAAASAIGAAQVRQRADYFRQFPVGTLPSLEACEL